MQDDHSIPTDPQQNLDHPLHETAHRDDENVLPPHRSNHRRQRTDGVIGCVLDQLRSIEKVDELIIEVMETLVNETPFTRAVLLATNLKEQKTSLILARGESGISDEFFKDAGVSATTLIGISIHSVGQKDAQQSSLGSSGFAWALLNAKHEHPIVLYADCGQEGVVCLEARRVFRKAVDLLNEELPSKKGALPCCDG